MFVQIYTFTLFQLNSLPLWLSYDKNSMTLTGSPNIPDIGHIMLNLSVKAQQDWTDCSDRVLINYINITVERSQIKSKMEIHTISYSL